MYIRLRNLREDNDLNQEDVAKFLNCTQACYSRYESGERDIPTATLKLLANFYKTSVDYILNETDQLEPYPKSTKNHDF